MFLTRERAHRPGGGHLQAIAFLDRIELVDNRFDNPCDDSAVVYGNAAFFIYGNFEYHFRTFFEIIHIPELVARVRDKLFDSLADTRGDAGSLFRHEYPPIMKSREGV